MAMGGRAVGETAISGLPVANARIEESVGQIDGEVQTHDESGDDEIDRLHHRVVEACRRLEEEEADPGMRMIGPARVMPKTNAGTVMILRFARGSAVNGTYVHTGVHLK